MSDWNDVLIELHDRFSALEKELRKASAEMSAIIRECVDGQKDEPQTHCPIAIIFSCDECPHPTNCKYKTDCKRCRHFATDNCHECYGNELFEESGYITELTNTSQTEREGE